MRRIFSHKGRCFPALVDQKFSPCFSYHRSFINMPTIAEIKAQMAAAAAAALEEQRRREEEQLAMIQALEEAERVEEEERKRVEEAKVAEEKRRAEEEEEKRAAEAKKAEEARRMEELRRLAETAMTVDGPAVASPSKADKGKEVAEYEAEVPCWQCVSHNKVCMSRE